MPDINDYIGRGAELLAADEEPDKDCCAGGDTCPECSDDYKKPCGCTDDDSCEACCPCSDCQVSRGEKDDEDDTSSKPIYAIGTTVEVIRNEYSNRGRVGQVGTLTELDRNDPSGFYYVEFKDGQSEWVTEVVPVDVESDVDQPDYAIGIQVRVTESGTYSGHDFDGRVGRLDLIDENDREGHYHVEFSEDEAYWVKRVEPVDEPDKAEDEPDTAVADELKTLHHAFLDARGALVRAIQRVVSNAGAETWEQTAEALAKTCGVTGPGRVQAIHYYRFYHEHMVVGLMPLATARHHIDAAIDRLTNS